MYTVCHSTMTLIMMPRLSSWFSLPDLVVPPQLAALAVEDGAGQGVAPLTRAEKVVNGPPVGRVVGVFEHVRGLDHPAELGQGTGEAGGAGAALQRAQDRRGDDGTGPQRGGKPADLVLSPERAAHPAGRLR